MRTIALRFSLLSLMGAVVVAAVACAALRFASKLWASALLTTTIGMLLASVLGSVLQRGPARAFWFGFTLFGSAYLILAFAPWCYANVRPQFLTSKLLAYLHAKLQPASPLLSYGSRVIGLPDQHIAVISDGEVTPWRVDDTLGLPVTTGQQLATLDSAVVNAVAFSADGRLLVSGSRDKTIKIWNVAAQLPTWEQFERVGHSLFALLVALLGGLLARYVFARRSLTDDASRSGADCSC